MRPAAPAGPLTTASLLTPSATSAEIARPSVMLLYTPSMKARRPWSTWTSERVAAAWGLANERLASIGFLALRCFRRVARTTARARVDDICLSMRWSPTAGNVEHDQFPHSRDDLGRGARASRERACDEGSQLEPQWL